MNWVITTKYFQVDKGSYHHLTFLHKCAQRAMEMSPKLELLELGGPPRKINA